MSLTTAFSSPMPPPTSLPPRVTYTTGSYAPPPAGLVVSSGSYAPGPSVPPAPMTVTRAAVGSTATVPSYTVVSGSYVPPTSGSYTAAPMMPVSGSYAPPVTSGSYTAPPPVLSGSLSVPVMASAVPAGMPMMPGAPLIPGGGSYSAPPPREGLPDPDTVAKQKKMRTSKRLTSNSNMLSSRLRARRMP